MNVTKYFDQLKHKKADNKISHIFHADSEHDTKLFITLKKLERLNYRDN